MFFFFTLSLRSGVIDRIHLSSILCLGGEIRFSWCCEYRLNGGSKPLYENMIHNYCSRWIKEASVTLVHTVWMGKFCNQGKADYSDMIVH